MPRPCVCVCVLLQLHVLLWLVLLWLLLKATRADMVPVKGSVEAGSIRLKRLAWLMFRASGRSTHAVHSVLSGDWAA